MSCLVMCLTRMGRLALYVMTLALVEGSLKGVTPDNYDRAVAPKVSVAVNYNLRMIALDDINIEGSFYTIQFELTIKWKDPRLLAYNQTGGLLSVPRASHDELWTPQMYMKTIREGSMFDSAIQMPLLDVDTKTKEVTYKQRFRVSPYCNMDFARYPMDTQLCAIDIIPFPKSQQIQPKWYTIDEALGDMASTLKANAYDLTTIETSYLRENEVSYIRVYFTFKKNLTSSLIAIFFPSTLIVVVTFVSFWIDASGAAARVTLCTTALLAMVTLMSGVKKDTPELSYLTALDIWFFACLIFCSLALFEFAIVYSWKGKRTAQETATVAPLPQKYHYKSTSPSFSVSSEEDEEEDEPSSLVALLREPDTFSRVLFPLLFALFQVAYWAAYQSSLLNDVLPIPTTQMVM